MWACANCPELRKVTLVGEVTEVGLSAFRECQSLVMFENENYIRIINGNAFDGC